MIQQFFGITPAPYHMRHMAEEQRKAEAERKVEPTPVQRKLSAR